MPKGQEGRVDVGIDVGKRVVKQLPQGHRHRRDDHQPNSWNVFQVQDNNRRFSTQIQGLGYQWGEEALEKTSGRQKLVEKPEIDITFWISNGFWHGLRFLDQSF